MVSLALYFLLMLGIGVYAYRVSNHDIGGYLLGGRNLGPAVTALSAGASDMSGWILMGLPGAMYLSGLNNIWIAVGLTLGAYFNYLLVAPRLRSYTELADNAITLPKFFENRFEDRSGTLRIVASITIIVFFTVYSSSGLVAGGKLFENAFQADYLWGIYITAAVVVTYTLFGGFLAVSMTDFVQGTIMLVALILVPITVLIELDGFASVSETLNGDSPAHMDWLAGMSLAAMVSSMAWGLGYFGQPHIIVRFMAIRSIKELVLARRIGMSWMVLSLAGAMLSGLLGVAYMAQTSQTLVDAETIFIFLSQVLFHPLIGGFLLAAILAAIMSTLSSQLLVTSSSLTEDIYRVFFKTEASQKQLLLAGRLSVVIVTLVAMALAQNRDSSVLQIVSHAWAGFGSAFGPLILLSLYWPHMTRAGALAGIITGAVTVLVWAYAPIGSSGQTLNQMIYAMVPGFLLSAAAIFLVSKLTAGPSPEMEKLFRLMEQSLKSSGH